MKFGLTRELVSEVTATDAMTFTLQMREFRYRERWSLLPRVSQKQGQYFHTSLLAFNPVSLNIVPQ